VREPALAKAIRGRDPREKWPAKNARFEKIDKNVARNSDTALRTGPQIAQP
jgi:hypothetical protein